RQVGFDREGRPLMYACFAQCQTLKNNPDDVVCHMVYLIEHAKRSIQTSVNTLVFIIDCTGLTVACCNPKIGKKFVQTFADCYPETLYKFILINHGTFFHGIWKAIKVFIDPNTVKKVKLIRKEKIQRTFNEMFTPDTITWLLDEIKLNKINITENQLRFWESPHSYELHDPRGTHEYIQRCIEPLKLFIEQQPQQPQQPKQQSNQKSIILTYDNLGLKTHMPHTNIMDCLNKTLKQVKIQSFYNGLTVACCNPKIGKKFVQTFADCYPETLYKFILINHGTFFHGIWKAIKVFIDPNTVKKVKLIRKEKIQRTFNEMFTPDTITWLLDEIKLNKINITENQLRFWESPHSYELHDPRGTHEYIQRCIEPLKLFIEQQPQQPQQPKQQSNQKSIILTYDNLGLKTHMPHTNIMDCLNKTLKQVKIQSFYNGKYIKPNKEELQAYGVDINDNLSEISLTVACCNPKIGKKFVQTFADCYPETLYKFILINHGTFFHGIWKAIKVFIDPNTVKKVKLIRKEKIQRTFNEMFTPDTITWLLDEIKLNKINITENQLRFWESPHSYELHDPRGTHEYIQRCIEPLKLFIEQQPQQPQQPKQQSNQKSIILTYDNLGLKTHMPHTNIMDCLNKTLKQVKIQSFYNGKYIKPNKEELQAYGVDINDNLSEISGGSEE
ncbi:uncharacterized protein DC041_0000330, partial [Schistosoma bovis]